MAPGQNGAGGLDGSPRTTASERVYRELLRLYPADVRLRFGDEMVVLFGDQLRDVRSGSGRFGVAAIWMRNLIDLAGSAVGEHLRRDRTVAQSLASFEPTRSMRWLGLTGVAGGVVLLWAFIAGNPFEDRSINTIRLALFWLGGIAIAMAFHRRLAAGSPRLAAFATAAVLIIGVWNVLWVILSLSQEDPHADAFGGIGVVGQIVGWWVQAVYGAVLFRLGSASSATTKHLRTIARLAALALVIGGPLAFLGINDRALANWSDYGFAFTTLGQIGLILTGIGWISLGALVVLAGARSRATA